MRTFETLKIFKMSFWYLLAVVVIVRVLQAIIHWHKLRARDRAEEAHRVVIKSPALSSLAPRPTSYRYESGTPINATHCTQGVGSAAAVLTTTLPKQNRGTIISSRASPALSQCDITYSLKHGLMAPLRRKQILVCFGCGKKSGIKYDGLITRWDCALCDNPNFLDEVSSPLCDVHGSLLNLMLEWRHYRPSHRNVLSKCSKRRQVLRIC